MIFTLLFATAFAYYGIDFSTYHSTSVLECFKNNGFTFTIPRCWCSTGVWDSNCQDAVELRNHFQMTLAFWNSLL